MNVCAPYWAKFTDVPLGLAAMVLPLITMSLTTKLPPLPRN